MKTRVIIILALSVFANINAQNYVAPTIAEVGDFSPTYYIDPSGSNGSGTIGSPYNTLDGLTIVSGAAYLIKAGETLDERPDKVWSNNYIGSYGTGDRPIVSQGFETASGTNGVTVVGLEIRKNGQQDWGQIVSLSEGNNTQNITFSYCKFQGIAYNDRYPHRGFQGNPSNFTLFNCEVAYTENDGIYLTSDSENDTIVSSWFHHNNMGGLNSNNSAGDAIQLEQGDFGNGYIANCFIDRSHTIWKFGLILNGLDVYVDQSVLTTNFTFEYNTILCPRTGNGGVGLWLLAKNVVANKNLIDATSGISAFYSRDSIASDLYPTYGIFDNHVFGSGGLGGTGLYTPHASNILYSDSADYADTYSGAKYGSDLDYFPFDTVIIGSDTTINVPDSIITEPLPPPSYNPTTQWGYQVVTHLDIISKTDYFLTYTGASNGDAVGEKYTVQSYDTLATITFSEVSDQLNAFNINSSTGLISVNNNTNIAEGTYYYIVNIADGGVFSESDTNWIKIVNTSDIHFITQAGGNFTNTGGKDYIFYNRGDTYTFNGGWYPKSLKTYAAYGTGALPSFDMTVYGGWDVLIDAQHTVEIRDIHFILDYKQGVVMKGTHSSGIGQIRFDNCSFEGTLTNQPDEAQLQALHLMKGYNGIVKDLYIKNCNFFNAGGDGIYLNSNGNATFNNLAIWNCNSDYNIIDANENNPNTEDDADGDCIQIETGDGGIVLVNSYLDRSSSALKFGFIFKTNSGATGNYDIINNMFIPPSDPDGVALYGEAYDTTFFCYNTVKQDIENDRNGLYLTRGVMLAKNNTFINVPNRYLKTSQASVLVDASTETYTNSGGGTGVDTDLSAYCVMVDTQAPLPPPVVTQFSLTINKYGGGTVTLSPSPPYDSATVVTITSTPLINYNFLGYTDSIISVDSIETIIMNTDKVVTSTFVYPDNLAPTVLFEYPLNGDMFLSGQNIEIQSLATDDGSVDSVTLYIDDVYHRVEQNAAYNWGHTFNSVGDSVLYQLADGSHELKVIVYDNQLESTVDSIQVTVGDTVPIYSLTVVSVNGAVTRSPETSAYDSNTTVTVTAIPDAGYAFTVWSGDLSTSDANETILMSENKSITASFAQGVYFTEPTEGQDFLPGSDVGVVLFHSDANNVSGIKLYLTAEGVENPIRTESFAPYTWGFPYIVNDYPLNSMAVGSYTLRAFITHDTEPTSSVVMNFTVTAPVSSEAPVYYRGKFLTP